RARAARAPSGRGAPTANARSPGPGRRAREPPSLVMTVLGLRTTRTSAPAGGRRRRLSPCCWTTTPRTRCAAIGATDGAGLDSAAPGLATADGTLIGCDAAVSP